MTHDIFLYNTLTKKREVFRPITEHTVTMYNCGPTVYHYAHIGNVRSYVFADTLRRMFLWNGYEVTQVINITDVGHLTTDADLGEDKMEKGARREGKTAWDVANFYEAAFFSDLDKLHIARTDIQFPRATQYINEQIAMVQTLEAKGHTYTTSDGVYFDTSTFPEYGALGGVNLVGLEEGARIGVNVEKRSPTDFALWKFSPKNEKREMEWDSPWGVGFPGWHIECSAMSAKLLGQPFDIHTGGIDHIPVHHNNEIAQSVCATGLPLAHYWMHNAFLTVGEGEKMAKSGDNFLTLNVLADKGYNPISLRYLFLTARYSSPLSWTFDALDASEAALQKLRARVSKLPDGDVREEVVTPLIEQFTHFINDDLDTPKALALLWDVLKDDALVDSEKRHLALCFDTVFGLGLDVVEQVEIPEEVTKLLTKRKEARDNKHFEESDRLRMEIESFGFTVKDTADGQEVVRG